MTPSPDNENTTRGQLKQGERELRPLADRGSSAMFVPIRTPNEHLQTNQTVLTAAKRLLKLGSGSDRPGRTALRRASIPGGIQRQGDELLANSAFEARSLETRPCALWFPVARPKLCTNFFADVLGY